MSDLGDVHASIEDDQERPRMPSGLPGGAPSVNKKYRSPKKASQEFRKRQNAFKIHEMSMLFKPTMSSPKAYSERPRDPQGSCRAHPETTQAPGSTLPSVPGNVPGAPRKPRNSPRTLSRLPKRPQVSKKGSQSLPKASQEVPGGPRKQTET